MGRTAEELYERYRTDEVKRRCRRTVQAQADALAPLIDAILDLRARRLAVGDG